MKRLITLIVLMGLGATFLLTGCNQGSTDTSTATNAPAAPSTNAPAK